MADQVIQLNGKFNVEFPLKKKHDYTMNVTGAVEEIRESVGAMEQDVFTYIFKPLYGEVTNEHGKTVKVVKKGSKSQVLRAKILACGLDYDQEMNKLIEQYE